MFLPPFTTINALAPHRMVPVARTLPALHRLPALVRKTASPATASMRARLLVLRQPAFNAPAKEYLRKCG
jgi:hypothetical protein